jgi:hypothetical protein
MTAQGEGPRQRGDHVQVPLLREVGASYRAGDPGPHTHFSFLDTNNLQCWERRFSIVQEPPITRRKQF